MEHVLYELKHFEDLIKAVQDHKSGRDPKKLEDIWMKAAAARVYAKEQGWLYRLITNRRLGHYAYNAAFLSYYRDMPLDHELAASLLADVGEWPGIHLQLLMQRRPKEQRLPALATVWTLLYQARLHANLSQRISNLVQVYPAGQPLHPYPVW